MEINYSEIQLYRRRYKPIETVCLHKDKILFFNEETLVTKWTVLKPREDLSRGISCYYLNEGFKISKFYNCEDKFAYWYCDIIEVEKIDNKYYFNDLLIDVIVSRDNTVKILDLADVSDTFENNLITKQQVTKALRSLDKLLQVIYDKNFNVLTRQIEDYE